MATKKNINVRVQLKHDVEANWDKATTFIPYAGEVIIYDKDSTHTEERIKIGDGSKTVVALPFWNYVTIDEVDEICGADIQVVGADDAIF